MAILKLNLYQESHKLNELGFTSLDVVNLTITKYKVEFF